MSNQEIQSLVINRIFRRDHLDETKNDNPEKGGNKIKMGVELNASNKPVAYFI